ncbi:unnamed protein product, partial [Cyprideis torosa]
MDMAVKGGWHSIHEAESGERRFQVTDLQHKKEYKFRIRALNKIGSSEPVTYPKIILAKDPWDEPGKPGDIEIVDWDKNHADIKWTKPENDGGAPITGYIIEFKGKFDREWTQALVLDKDICEASVPGLKEGQTYEFRVKAVNKAGPGEPSNASKPIIAKDRFVKPFLIDKLENIVIKKGQVIKFDIKYGGEPEPDVLWVKDGEDLTSVGDKPKVTKRVDMT